MSSTQYPADRTLLYSDIKKHFPFETLMTAEFEFRWEGRYPHRQRKSFSSKQYVSPTIQYWLCLHGHLQSN